MNYNCLLTHTGCGDGLHADNYKLSRSILTFRQSVFKLLRTTLVLNALFKMQRGQKLQMLHKALDKVASSISYMSRQLKCIHI